MAPERIVSVARTLVLASAVALLVVFFLDWWRVSIDAPGARVESSTSGWSGWGLVASIRTTSPG